ncbi:MAG TPA: hypothetical protein VLI67_07575, partial [Vicinamibacteria bacterium]|nr:hypothetical protein [Vicinamibacteria bacterium]
MLAPVAVLVAAACHEGRLPISTSPTDSGAGVLTILSGETQSPVAGARVLVAGEVYSSDASGRVFLRLTSSELDIEASGYLDRQTLLSSDRFTLWPRSSPTGLDEDSTARLVYGCAAPGCPGGGEPLMRLPRGAAVLVPSGGLRADRRAVEALEEGARRLSSAAEGEITLDVAANPRSSAALVTVQVDGRDPVILALGAGAVTRRELTARSEIVRASITFRTLEL